MQRAQRNKNSGALIERKLAILDRALVYSPADESLLMAHVSLVAQHASADTAMERWSYVLKQVGAPRVDARVFEIISMERFFHIFANHVSRFFSRFFLN